MGPGARWANLAVVLAACLAADAKAAFVHFTEAPAFEASADGTAVAIVARNLASDCDPRGSCSSGGYIGLVSVQLWAFETAPPQPNPGQASAVDLSHGHALASTTFFRYDPASGRSDAKSGFVPLMPAPPGSYQLAVLVLGSGATGGSTVLYDSFPYLTPVTLAGRAPTSPDVRVVEYYNASFDHYFMTPLAVEIGLCDTGAVPCAGWMPTGFTFRASHSAVSAAAQAQVCRFYNDSFAPSSHFYALRGQGCEATLQYFPDWRLESDSLFQAQPLPSSGACPGTGVPVYRLYNDGKGGAPNHRFLTDATERQRMVETGWIPEGYGTGIAMCALGG